MGIFNGWGEGFGYLQFFKIGSAWTAELAGGSHTHSEEHGIQPPPPPMKKDNFPFSEIYLSFSEFSSEISLLNLSRFFHSRFLDGIRAQPSASPYTL